MCLGGISSFVFGVEFYIVDCIFFSLLKKFIELLRKGTRDDCVFAIDYLRKSLAPCALNAYPVTLPSFFSKFSSFR